MSKQLLRLTLGIAIVSGLAVTFGIYRYLSQVDLAKRQHEETVVVVVARKDIARGTKLTAEHAVAKRKEGKERPEGSFADINAVLGRVINESLPEGAYITSNSLLPRGKSAVVSRLKPGYRAVTVLVDARQHSNNLINIGDFVDVVVTFTDDDFRSNATSKLVLQKVEVLLVPTETEEDRMRDSNRKAAVTLALLPWEAEKLALSMQLGEIQLLVRGFEDDGVTTTSGVTWDTLIPKEESAVAAAQAYRSVELIKGNERTLNRFQEDTPLDSSLVGARPAIGGAQTGGVR